MLYLKEIFERNTSENRFAPLDGLRALSILFVIAFHVFFFSQYAFDSRYQYIDFSSDIPFWLVWIKRGDLGVDIFFVLSAFLIGSQLFCEKKKSGTIKLSWFYTRRFIRIYPLYLFALLIVVLTKGWDYNILGNIFAYNNLYNLDDIVIPWSWSLSVEIQFYLIAPWIIHWVRSEKQILLFCFSLCLFSLLWMSYFYFNNAVLAEKAMIDILVENDKETMLYYMQFLYVVPPARIPAFAFGLVAAWYWVYHKEHLVRFVSHHRHTYHALLVLSVVVIIGILQTDLYLSSAAYSKFGKSIYSFMSIAGRPLFSLCVAAILLFSLSTMECGGRVSRALSHRAFYPIAKVSFSMYLFHPLFLFAAFYILFGEQKLHSLAVLELSALFIIATLLSFVFGIFTYYLVERWFICKRFTTSIKNKIFHIKELEQKVKVL